jgi:hypothetical protein
VDQHLITQDQQGLYLLSVDPHGISVATVFNALSQDRGFDLAELSLEHHWQDHVLTLMASYRTTRSEQLGISLAQLFTTHEAVTPENAQ